jgi:Cyclic GMP-AMP synthase DncV-like, nucleotidyltransferase domain
MYDMHKELNEFYDEHVRLKEDREKLASYRDTNLDRLKAGLEKLSYPSRFESINQGSYAMHTINKHPHNDYDIDVAIIFADGDLPSGSGDARKRIEEAMIEGGGDFSTLPEAKTNAVRVSYAAGHHVDLAVYRRCQDILGIPVIEHAGPEWAPRDPSDITDWFISSVQRKSPAKDFGATVEDKQLRRVVRWLKMFSKSRSSWNMPGGLILSALAVECYVLDNNRDDVSLYETMGSIRNRLRWNKEVMNPLDPAQSLTSRQKDQTRVTNLQENLDFVLGKLDVLLQQDCDCEQALKAWDWVFQHTFWKNKLGESLKEALASGTLGVTVTGRLVSTDIKKNEEHVFPVPRTRFYGGK